MLIAAFAMLINFWKAIRERRVEVRQDAEKATKAGAERDNIAVHSAEAALLLMEKMLNQANVAVEKLQQRLEAAECKYTKCAEELRLARGAKEDS